jgi:putative spermidine/putrescine transport system permease protein
VLFLYSSLSAILLLSFQGPAGGLTFPMHGFSAHWFTVLFTQQRVGDFWGAFQRSLALATLVMLSTVVLSLLAGLAFRKRFRGDTVLFYIAVANLIVPSILISLGIGLMFDISGWETTWYSSGLGAHLTWTLPFVLLIMFAVFNRFNPAYEEAGRDLGASGWQTIIGVVVPIIAPSLIGIALFGFTLSYDELGRTLLTVGVYNSLPLEIYGMTTNITFPALYALGTLTTGFSFGVMGIFLAVGLILRRRNHQVYQRGTIGSGGPAARRARS